MRFGLTSLKALNAFENFVYEGVSEVGDELVLRISHSLRRTFDYTLGELEFVRFLAAGGLPVAQPVAGGRRIGPCDRKRNQQEKGDQP